MIPKIIHHVWIGSKPFPNNFKAYRESWIRQHPDWTFYFWTDDNLPEMSAEVKSIVTEENYLTSIRADILRLQVLKLYGGIYSDTDIECLKPFDEFLNYDFFAGRENDQGICNALMGTIKDSNIINSLLSQCIRNINQYTIQLANVNSLQVSATIPLTNLLTSLDLGTNNIKVFDPVYFYPIPPTDITCLVDFKDSYAVHYWAGQDDGGWANTETQKRIRKSGINSLYQIILNREADELGLEHYFQSELTMIEIENVLYNSREYRNLNKSNFYNNSGTIDLDFLEIGTSDYDTILQTCSADQIGMSIEPVKYYLDRLPNKPNVKKFNMAISFHDSETPIEVYYVTSDVIEKLQLPDWVRGCNSIGNYHFQHKELKLEEYVKIDSVKQMPIDKFLIENNIRGIDFLKIDVEGGDCFILKTLMEYLKNKTKEYYPKTIMFETNALTEEKLISNTIQLYCINGYDLISFGHETVLKLK
jgi:FkbM family methyltransferase